MTDNYDSISNDYIALLKNLSDGAGRILAADNVGLIDDADRRELNSYRSKADRLREKIEKNEFEIAIVGLEKAGKSTFANAIMGNDILPSKSARCTYTSTSIRYADTDDAIVNFFSIEEFDESFAQRMKLLGMDNPEYHDFRRLPLTEYQRLFEGVDESLKNLYSGTLNKDIEDILSYRDNIQKYVGHPVERFTGDEITGDFFKGFIQDPKYAIAVKEITIRSGRLDRMRNAVIYDVPGFDSPTKMHKDQTIDKMKQADAIILIASAERPSLTGPLIDIFRNESDDDGTRFSDKLFVFANYADHAPTLEENMNELRGDLTKHRIMKQEHLTRVVPGSARAKLEEDGKAEGHDSIDGLKSRGIGNGVDRIVEMLEEYNRSDRFEVLKRRADQYRSNAFALIEKLRPVSGEGGISTKYSESNADISTQILIESGRIIRENLEAYDTELTAKYNREAVLSNKMENDVISQISCERFGVKQEEIEKAANKVGLTSTMEYGEKVDMYIREEIKYPAIYREFTYGIVNLAADEHRVCDEKIKEIFLKGLGVHENNIYYEQICDALTDYLEQQKETSDNTGYYKSLVERFSIDLFELLIKLPFGSAARWKRFKTDKAIFYSLGVFGGEDEEDENGGFADYRQALSRLLLFHDEETSKFGEYYKKVMSAVTDLIGAATSPKLSGLVKNLVLSAGEGALGIISDMLKDIDRNKPAETMSTILVNFLEADGYSDRGRDIDSEAEISEESYERFFDGKRNKSYEDVKAEIEKDIDILRTILSKCVLPAICLEKAFIALEHTNIENILRTLNADADIEKYRQFIVSNIRFIAAEELRDMDFELQKETVRNGIREEIDRIYNSMKEA